MQSNRGSLAWMLYPRKHFDMSGKSAAAFHHRAVSKHCQTATTRVTRPNLFKIGLCVDIVSIIIVRGPPVCCSPMFATVQKIK
jgi:hypothetical protein